MGVRLHFKKYKCFVLCCATVWALVVFGGLDPKLKERLHNQAISLDRRQKDGSKWVGGTIIPFWRPSTS